MPAELAKGCLHHLKKIYVSLFPPFKDVRAPQSNPLTALKLFHAVDVDMMQERHPTLAPGILYHLLNYDGTGGGKQHWSDTNSGPNPLAVAQILVHANASKELRGFLGFSPAAGDTTNCLSPHFFSTPLRNLIEQERLEALPALMGSIEVFLFTQQSVSAAAQYVLQHLLYYFQNLAKSWATLLPNPDDALIERMLHLSMAISRIAVLFPMSLSCCLIPNADSPNDSSLPLLQLATLTEFLHKTSRLGRFVEWTSAWEWNAIDPSLTTQQAALDSTLPGTHGRVCVTEKLAKGIPIRRHLLRLLAGPVTHLSPTDESTAFALARPTLAIIALIARKRLERAIAVHGAELWDVETAEEFRLQATAEIKAMRT